VPVYSDCVSEFETFNSVYPYNAKLHGTRKNNIDRSSFFCDTLKGIQMHNERALVGNSTHSQGINEFSDWSHEERSGYMVGGYIPVTEEENAALNLPLYEAPHEYTGQTADFRNRMPASKNQGSCGSCWTFGAVDVIDFYGGSHSEQQILDCETKDHGCDGGDPRRALSYLAGAGSMKESQYQYKGKQGQCKARGGGTRVSSVKAVGSNEAALASAAGKQVVSIAITFQKGKDSSFMNYKNGIFGGVCQNREAGGHAIATVGITNAYYIVRNSWRRSWGQQGNAYIKRGHNICNLAQHPTVAKASGASPAMVGQSYSAVSVQFFGTDKKCSSSTAHSQKAYTIGQCHTSSDGSISLKYACSSDGGKATITYYNDGHCTDEKADFTDATGHCVNNFPTKDYIIARCK
jgi:hypothetical protein